MTFEYHEIVPDETGNPGIEVADARNMLIVLGGLVQARRQQRIATRTLLPGRHDLTPPIRGMIFDVVVREDDTAKLSIIPEHGIGLLKPQLFDPTETAQGNLIYEMPNPGMICGVYDVLANGHGILYGVVAHRESVESVERFIERFHPRD